MPIKKINPDGTIDIVSNDGSKQRTVTADEWTRDYGKPLPVDYDNQVKQAKQQSLTVPSGQMPSTGASPYQATIDKIKQQKEQMNKGTSATQTTQAQPTDNLESLRQSYRQAAESDPANANYYFDQFKSRTGFGIDETKPLTEIEKKQLESEQTPEQLNEVKDTIDNIDSILKRDLKFIGTFGKIVSKIPGKNNVTADMIQQVKDQLALASVGKLKGQGQVTEMERQMLANASSILDVDMPLEDFKNEMNKVRKYLSRKIEGNKELPPTQEAQTTQVQKTLPTIESKQKAKQTAQDVSKYILSEGEYNKKNKLAEGAAKVQEFLGKSETLPAIYGTVGGIVGGPAGAGVGAATGERMRQAAETGNVGEYPDLKEGGKILLKGVEYAALDKLLSMGGKYVSEAIQAKSASPSKIAIFMREKAAEATPEIDATKIIEAGDRWAKLDPQSADIWNELRPAIGEKMPTKDLLDVLTAWGKRTWNLSGNQKDKAGSELMKKLYSAGRDEILTQAPKVAEYTKQLKEIKDAPGLMKGAQKASWLLLKLLGIGKLI